MSQVSFRLIACLIISFGALAAGWAGIPPYLNVQGRLTDDVGTPLDGDFNIAFCIYEYSEGGSELWCSDGPVNIPVSNGLFEYLLGSSQPFPDSLVNYDSMWVAISVEGGGELIPRTPLVSVAYAVKALRADEGGGWTQGESVVHLLDDTDSVGIGTDAPAAVLDVRGSIRVGAGIGDADVNFYGSASVYRLSWDASKHALRLGQESLGQPWTDENIGFNSIGVGEGVLVSGGNSVGVGVYANATGSISQSLGFSTEASGNFSTAIGAAANATGNYSRAIGMAVTAAGDHSIVLGNGLSSSHPLLNNIDESLMIGFGDTLHTMFMDGDSVYINGSLSVSKGEFNDVNFYGDSSDYRFFWDASKAALRVGLEGEGPLTWDDANVGLFSFAAGYKNMASGLRSTALGSLGLASGQFSFTAGFSSEATGIFSVAIGYENEATGYNSLAIGSRVISSAEGAIALGNGIDYLHPMENNIEKSFMVGFSDSLVSLFVEDGAVGVGTSAPEDMLHVKNSNANGRAFLWIEADHPTEWQEAGIRFETPQNRWHLRLDDYSNNNIPDGSLALRSNDLNGEVMTWSDLGDVGIGVITPGYKLDVAGSVHASSFPTSSDTRFKTNVTGLTGVLDKIDRVRGVTFEWNDRYAALGRSTGHREIGVIAQEIEQVFPELVTTWGDEEYRAVDYGRLSAVLLEAVKELKSENDALKARIEALEQKR